MIIESTTRLTPTNLSDPLMEVSEMLIVYSFSVQRELKSRVVTSKLVDLSRLEFIKKSVTGCRSTWF